MINIHTCIKKTTNKISLSILIILLLHPVLIKGQSVHKQFKQEDVWNIFTTAKNQAKRDSISARPKVVYKPYFALAPFVGFNPAYGFLLGVSGSIGMYLGNPKSTPISSTSMVINFTTKSQLILNLRSNIITGESRYILRGDWRYMIFSQPTYGLGSGIEQTGVGEATISDSSQKDPYAGVKQPINYNYFRFYETFYFRIFGSFYAGLGYNLDKYAQVEDKNLQLDSVPPQYTSHYKYSTEYGFHLDNQTMSGISLELLFDSRDHSIRPTKGYFANIAFRPNFHFLGSSRSSVMLNTEFRTYVGLSTRRPEHLIGFWYLGQFTEKDDVPYLGLPAIGWDMYNRTGRGYIQGSIRGVNFMYGETEYRFPISRYSGILGGVVFINATTANSADGTRTMFQYVDPGAGLGLRIMFNRKTLSNVAVDVGVGKNGWAIYFNLNETF